MDFKFMGPKFGEKMIMKYILLFVCLFFSGCGPSCTEYAENHWRPLSFNFVVTHKSLKFVKEIRIEGVDSAGNPQLFKNMGWYDLYDTVRVGDTLRKIKGECLYCFYDPVNLK